MSYIKTWIERCDEHPDHQSGMVSTGMIQARMQEEIDDLRADNERLRDQIYESIPKWQANELQREIDRLQPENERLRAENERLRAKIKWLIEDDERLHSVLYRIANPPPFADCPVEMAQNATRGEHLRREAFDGIRRALEGKP